MKLLYFSCEVGNREYPGRLLLGAYLAKLGWATVIGHKNAVDHILGQLGPGILITKDTATPTAGRLDKAKEQGCVVGGLDEELLDFHGSPSGLPNEEQFVAEYCLAERYLNSADFYIACNRFSANLAKTKRPRRSFSLPSLRLLYSLAIREVGLANSIEEPSGLLFPTHLGTINSIPIGALAAISGRTRTVSAWELLQEQRQLFDLDLRHFKTVCDFLDATANSGMLVTLRPHPGENSFELHHLLKSRYEHISSIDLGGLPILNFLQSTSLLVSAGCSSLIEASVAGRAVVCLQKERDVLLSSQAISVIPIDDWKYSPSLRSTVDVGRLNDELFLGGVDLSSGLQNWSNMLSEISPVERDINLSSVRIPSLGFNEFMRRRIGVISKDYVEAVLGKLGNFFCPRGLRIAGTTDALIISAES